MGRAVIAGIGCVFLAFACGACFSSGRRGDSDNGGPAPGVEEKGGISWKKPATDKEETITAGSIKAGFGTFVFQWVTDAGGRTALVTMESSGSAELPPIRRSVLPMVTGNKTTLLFLERFPLLNGREPSRLSLIASVSTAELFSVLPAGKLPPASPSIENASPLLWGEISMKKGANFLPGTLSASFGKLNILWKKTGSGVPALILEESLGAGELPPVESPLYAWMEESSGTTMIFQQRQAQLNQKFVPHLWALARVKTDELMEGFRRLE